MELDIAKSTQQNDQNYFMVNNYFERTYETIYSIAVIDVEINGVWMAVSCTRLNADGHRVILFYEIFL